MGGCGLFWILDDDHGGGGIRDQKATLYIIFGFDKSFVDG